MLPGENDYPLPEGAISTSVTATDKTLTDSLAVYYDPIRGQMPGFDPRMDTSVTGYPYDMTVITTPGQGISRIVQSLSGETVAIKAEVPDTTFTAVRARLRGRDVPARAQLARNELCQCGSGRRFKHCHGRLA